MTTTGFQPTISLDHLAGPRFADLDHELDLTRVMLAAVPDGRDDWRPHERSMTLGRLASHVAEIPMLVTTALTTTDFDVVAAGGLGGATYGGTAERLAVFDRAIAGMREALAAATPESLDVSWTLRAGDTVFLRAPRHALVRGLGVSHLVHHRAQLGVYLRMLDVRVPGMYGPSADDPTG